MKISYPEMEKKIDDIIKKNYIIPIDLLSHGDTGGEMKYIQLSKKRYIKTIVEITEILQDTNEPEDIKILDIGSFLGVVDISLATLGFDVTTYDIPEFQDNENLKNLYQKYGVHIGKGNLKNVWNTGLPYPDNSFDVIIFAEILEHLNFNPLPLLQEINRISKRGAILYLSTPNLMQFKKRKNFILGRTINPPIDEFFLQLDPRDNMIVGIHWREYNFAECVDLFKKMGFSLIKGHYSTSGDDGFTLNPKSWIGYFILKAMPSLRSDLIFLFKKEKSVKYDFWLTEANT